tara:strand:- start:56 stop:229 length:174 start_codon:yes stop_codon:yes gene_type:complete
MLKIVPIFIKNYSQKLLKENKEIISIDPIAITKLINKLFKSFILKIDIKLAYINFHE